ncbi:MAG: CheR family methyltransferase, partial [Acetobacteraceae bacterium]
NGTQGLKEIKAAGGLILIQDPATARVDGMPRSAISAGLADHIQPPTEMGGTILRYVHHGYVAAPGAIPAPVGGLELVLDVLRARAGQDFRPYKPAMLLRRINRRMSLRNIEELGVYIELLRSDPDEIPALVRDMLISITSFFRDDEAWSAFAEAAITPLVGGRETGAGIRVWVPACATGEEAYSVAMLLIERAEAEGKHFDLKIFASDPQDVNLNTARDGVYPGSGVEMLPPETVRRFFEKLDGAYRVRKELRDLVVFARQDVLRDPPFSRMDLITCRNMLIYIEPDAQTRVIALFHFALRQGGHLFLGSAESIGRADDLFGTVSKKWRIYCRLGPTRHDIVQFPVLGGHPQTHLPAAEPVPRTAELARRALLDRYAPASVLIDQKGHVLYFHGPTGDYLEQPTGEPTRDLLAMAREGLVTKLRGAIHTVFTDNEDTRFSADIRQGDGIRPTMVTLARLAGSRQALVLVSFEPSGEHAEPLPGVGPPASEEERGTVAALEEELRSARKDLQSTIEQLESANEELKASNEEATSMNEELQSTNEELETSKEELQSFNEELHTVNSQLQHKVKELEDTGDDLANLLSGTEVATIFLDTDLRIKWFSPTTKPLLDLVLSDIGRPFAHFARKFDDDCLMGDADLVLDKLTRIDAEIRTDDGKWFLRRMLPYRTRDNRIAGLVLTFTDITARRLANEAIHEARIYAEAIVATTRQPLVILDADLQVRSANPAFHAQFDLAPDGTAGRRIYELHDGDWDIAELRRVLEEVLPDSQEARDVAVELGPDGPGRRTLLLNARKLERKDRETLILLAIEDITERRGAAAHQEMLVGELSHRIKNTLATVQAIMSQTLRSNVSMDDFRRAFEGRLNALAEAHGLLVDKNWVGTEIGQIVTRTLEPYRSEDGDRIAVRGPRLTMRPQKGIALAMIFHELATNAAKYGALSVPAGQVGVSWYRDGDAANPRVHVEWREARGPRVALPTRRGFGTKLIERGTAHELGGEARLEYAADGVRCDLIFPSAEFDPTDRA